MDKTVLVTGSSGFVGTHFIKSTSGWNIKEADLLREDVGTIDFHNCRCVLHLAALVHQTKEIPEAEYFRVNRDLSSAVAKRAKQQGVRHFIFMSTVKVYGESSSGREPLDENSKCGPEDAYGKSKLEGEKQIIGLADDSFRVAVIRSPVVYGPGVRANMLSLLGMVRKLPVLPFGGIENRRSVVFIENLVALIQKIMELEADGIFVAGDAEPISTSRLVQLMIKGFGRHTRNIKLSTFLVKVLHGIKPSLIERLWGSFEINNEQTNKRLKFRPPYSTEDGILETAKWYKNMKKLN